MQLERLKMGTSDTTFGGSTLKVVNSPLQTDHDGVCPVVGTKLAEYICNMSLDRVLSDREQSGNLFVGIPARDQSEHIYLARA